MPSDMQMLHDDVRSEVSRLREETNRRLTRIEVRIDCMRDERVEAKLWWLRVAMFGAVIAIFAASFGLSQQS